MTARKRLEKIETRFVVWLTCLALFVLIGQPLTLHSAVIEQKETGKVSPGGPEFNYVPGEVLVKFKQNVLAREKEQFHTEANAEILSTLPQIGVHRVKGKSGESTEELLNRYRKNPFVEYAEPNLLFRIQVIPNDPQFNQLYGLYNTGQTGGLSDADIDAPEAWDLQTGSNSVIVADIDTGVDYNHADLAANMWTNPGEVAGNGIDDDNNGKIDDVRGWDFVNNDNNPFDDHGHGTHTSGTIAAVGNNGVGITGVAWQAKIMPLKFLGADGSGDSAAAAAAIIYAADMGAKISNNSWGCDGTDPNCFQQTVEDAIAYANTKGMLFVVSAGNGGSDQVGDNNDITLAYPCNSSQSNVICVAATDHNDQRASFSNYGINTVHLGAPGVDVVSTVPTGNCGLCTPSGYLPLGGTSMAAPHVAGAAALLRAQFPTATTAQIKLRILNNVDSIGSMIGLTVTGGRLNIDKALRAPNPVIAPTNLTAVDRPTDSGGAINLSWTPSTDTGITQQRVYRSTVSTGPFSLLITFNNNTTTGYTDMSSLIDGTRYYYVVRAFNGIVESANSNRASAYPINNSDVTAPTLSNIFTTDITASVARVLWTTTEISDTEVEYGTTIAYGSSTPLKTAFVTDHSVTISNLSPSTLYHYRVKSRDVAGNLAVSPDFTFTTLPPGSEGTWTAKSSTPGSRSFPGVGVIGNTLYVAGGNSVSVWFHAYDPSTNSWSNRPLMPTGRWSLGVGVIGNILYAVGGYETFAGSRATVEAYNPSTNSWDTTKAPMHVARSGLGVGVVNGKLYAVGGFDSGGGALSVVEEYDPSTNSWSFKSPMPTPRGNMGFGVINGILYATGGWNGAAFVATVEAYDPATDSWTTKASLPTARGGMGAGVINNLFYVVGGQTDVTPPLPLLSETLTYNPIDDAWATRTSMPTARAGLGAGVLNGLLYAIAGHDNQGAGISTVEAYTPFTQPTLIVTKAGTGTGTVTSSPAGINCGATCSASFALNTSVTLTATPASGSTFAGWSGACSGTGNCIVTMDATKSVTATFNASNFTLTVTKAGAGTGTVTSSPAGINCGATCSASFSSGTSVTLTASPASGSTFTGWSGDCSGTGTCIVTMTVARSVTATFNDTQAPTAPPSLTATPVSGSQINLSWTASTDNIGVSGYWIERCQGAGCSNFARINPSLVTATNYSDTGLTAGTSYSYRVQAADAAGNLSGYSNTASAITPAPLNGKILYSIAANTTPRTRDYTNTTNTFSAAVTTVAGSTAIQTVLRSSPTKNEMIAGYVNSSGILQVMCYNGTAWTNDWTVTVGGTGSTRRFDISYETNTGDVIVLYSRNVGTLNELGYRTKPGSAGCGVANWSAATNFDPTVTSGIVHWVKLAWDRRGTSNLITAIWADANSDLGAAVWSGTAWGNQIQLETTLQVVTAAQDVEDFDVEYESLSGDVMVVWGRSVAAGANGVRYATCTGGTSTCTWSAVLTPPTWLDDATHLDLSANPNTDEMVFASIGKGQSDLQVGYWSGSAWTNTANRDTTTALPTAGTRFVATGWLINGSTTRSIITYYDSGATNIGWVVGNGGVFTLQTDFAPTPALATQRQYDIQMDPINKDRLMFTVSNSSSDIFAKRLVMSATGTFTWSNADGGAALELNTASTTYKTFDFAYSRYTGP